MRYSSASNSRIASGYQHLPQKPWHAAIVSFSALKPEVLPGVIAIYFVSAIVISSVVFGIGHLPIAPALEVDFTFMTVAFIVLAKSLFGLIAGYLYWQKGLEAAIIAHMSTHIVIIIAIHLVT